MAGNLKPDVPGLGPEGEIIFGESAPNFTELIRPGELLDGIILSSRFYPAIFLDPYYRESWFTFTLHQVANIWSIANKNSDGTAESNKPINLYKLTEGTYQLVGVYPINPQYGVWYKLFSKLDFGTYKIAATSRYAGFDEWYVESLYDGVIYLKDNTAYGMKDNLFTKLEDNWTELDNVDKKALFIATNPITAPIKDLATLGKFKILIYSKADNTPIIPLTAIPKDQLILPKGLINIDSFEGIDKSTLTSTVSGNGAVLRFDSTVGMTDLMGNAWTNNEVTFTSPGKFAGQAAYFNGSTVCGLKTLTNPNKKLNLTADFTITFWLKSNKINPLSNIIMGNNTGGIIGYADPHNPANPELCLSMTLPDENFTRFIHDNNAFKADDTWHYITFTRKKDVLRLFVNGIKQNEAITTAAFNYGNTTFMLGGRFENPDQHACCYIDDFCILNGTALWTSDFTVPTNYLSVHPTCKLLVTNDLTTYKTYDFTAQEWQTVDHTDIATAKEKGIAAADLPTIPRTAWDQITTGKQGIGFAYLLSIENTSDVCSVDNLNLTVDMKGSWDKAVHGADYTYGYPANNVLKVMLKSNGDYKINYSEGAKEI